MKTNIFFDEIESNVVWPGTNVVNVFAVDAQNGVRKRRRTRFGRRRPEIGSSEYGLCGPLQLGRSLHATSAVAQETH